MQNLLCCDILRLQMAESDDFETYKDRDSLQEMRRKKNKNSATVGTQEQPQTLASESLLFLLNNRQVSTRNLNCDILSLI